MIDWGRVGDLRAEVGEEDFAEIVAIFRDEVEEVIARLGAPGTRVAEDLHFLKGSALNLGFEALARLCQEGERITATAREPAPVPVIDSAAVVACYRRSLEEFLAGVKIS